MQPANPKVSVIVPVYNVQDYLRECLDSIVNQTLRDLEVIAINDGSTDSSPQILAEYAARDSRIRVISKPNEGYGATMNRGLAEARGDYIGIVESDDYIDPTMYERYVAAAEANDADLVKSNYYEHDGRARRGRRDVPLNLYEGLNVPYGKPISPRDIPALATVRPCLWAALYRRDWLLASGIDFAPTPGASFQDTSFYFMTWFAARRAVILREPFLHYRIDSAGSSKTSRDKVFAGNDEFVRALAFLRARDDGGAGAAAGEGAGEGDAASEGASLQPGPLRTFGPVLGDMWFGCLVWHYNRMADEHRLAFAERWSAEMRSLFEDDLIDLSLLMPESLNDLHLLMASPGAFCRKHADHLSWPGFTYEHPQIADRLALVTRHLPATAPHPAASAAPAVSVILPIYNVEDYVRECVESLLAQTFANFEVLCVNDGSTDNSLLMAKSAARGDGRFRWLERPNGGLSAARNTALQHARGTFLLFVDSDDLLAPHALQTLVDKAVADDLDYLDFTARNFYESPDVPRDEYQERYMSRHAIPGVMSGRRLFVEFQRLDEFFCPVWLHFAKRSLLADDLRFREDIIHEDELFSPLLIQRAERASYLNEQLYVRRMRRDSLVTSKRGIRNVASVAKVVALLEDWLRRDIRLHAQDDAFHAAFADRIAFLRAILATDAELAGDAELDRYEATLAGEDLAQFRLQVRGSLAIRRQALQDAESSTDYRLGRTLLAAPRVVRDHMRR